MKGHIQPRGENTWRLKFDAGRDPGTGKRFTRFVTFKGTKREAQRELARLISTVSDDTFLEPSKLTLADYLRTWVADAETAAISARTAERYRQLIKHQIVPHLGALPLQKLRPANVATWHASLLREGRRDGTPLSSRTVGHAHRVLHKALADALRRELILRNPASVVSPPKVGTDEVEILSSDQIKAVLLGLRDTPIFAQVVTLLSTGMRRGELMGLRWSDLELETGKCRIEHAVEKTAAHKLRIKAPKTKYGLRVISLPAFGVEVLRAHRKAQLEVRMAIGAGKLPDNHFVFGGLDGSPRDPDRITQDWKRYAASRGLPKVTLHALRHSHASALIAAGQDVLTISRRLGHGSPNVTLGVYAHVFDKSDESAAIAIDLILSTKEN